MDHRMDSLKRCVTTVVLMGCLLAVGCVAGDVRRSGPGKDVDLDGRVAWYTRALKENPDDPALMIELKNARQAASMAHLKKAEALIENKFYRDAITHLQMSIAFYPANTRAVELITRAKNLKASLALTKKGEAFVKQEKIDNALSAFQSAAALDPENRQARDALVKYAGQQKKKTSMGMDFKSQDPITIRFKKTSIIEVFEVLSKIAHINFVFDKDVRESPVTLFMAGASFKNFFEVLLKTSSLAAITVDEHTLLIYPDTSAKHKIYRDLYVKTFYLSHLMAKDGAAMIGKILKTENMVFNDALNAITVRGRKPELDMAEKIILANDLGPSEVVLNVEILEVSRSKEKNLGLSFSDSITLGISETSAGITYSADSPLGFAGIGSLNDIGNLTSKELYLSLPTATLNLLKQDADTRILAQPRIRVKNHGKASILIGERIPLRSNRKVQTDGSITYDFQYQDVGIKFTSEPVITAGNQVNLKLELEISSLGTNVGGENDPQYAIRTKSASTLLTINDGDTVILGGLIQDEDRESIKTIPLLGDLPAVGRLFSREMRENVETDILMSITPVVIRTRAVPAKGVTGFWSGTITSPSTEVPFGREGVAVEEMTGDGGGE